MLSLGRQQRKKLYCSLTASVGGAAATLRATAVACVSTLRRSFRQQAALWFSREMSFM
jgi:hypothetical protein